MNKINYQKSLDDSCKKYIVQRLIDYNATKSNYLNPIIYEQHRKKFGFYAYDNEKIVGGACGFVDDEYWTFLDILFVDDQYRNQHIGSHLMYMIEQFAKDNQCVGIRVCTWDFQAKPFYEKQGFTVYGKLENHPPGITEYLLKKILITDEKDFPMPIE